MNDGRAAVAFSRLLRVFLCQFGEKYYFCRWFLLKDNKNEKYEKTGSYQGNRF